MKQVIFLYAEDHDLDFDDDDWDADTVLTEEINKKVLEGYQLVSVIAPTRESRIAYMRFVGARI